MDEYREANRRLWDEWADLHFGGAYDVDGFRAGRDNLRPVEVQELGDVAGKTLLHLQCHFGIDTLCWARRGAIVTGADFSPKAIAYARRLAAEVGLAAKFVESELYELPDRLEASFDIVYTSVGVVCWLPDIEGWARVVSHFLKPGGTFYVLEFHPLAQALDDTPGVTEPRLRYPYFSRPAPLRFEVLGSYAARAAKIQEQYEYGWSHGLGEIVTALIGAGLRIELLREHPFTLLQQFPYLERRDDGTYRLPAGQAGELPLLFSVRATKL